MLVARLKAKRFVLKIQLDKYFEQVENKNNQTNKVTS